MKKKKQKRVIGDILKVPFDSNFHTYARVLNDSSYAFYDYKTDEDILDLDLIISKPILFITSVNNYAVTDGLWEVIGHKPLEEKLLKHPPMAQKKN